MKTARFTDLVNQAGAPEPYLLWVPPKDDRVFQRAIKENRILTIHQENVGTKKDYGMIGFHEEPNAQFLVFTKSLKSFADRRVIGINYDLLAKDSRAVKPATKDARVPEPRAKKKVEQKTAEKPKIETKVDTETRAPSSRKMADVEDEAKKIVAFQEPPAEPPAPKPELPPKATRLQKPAKGKPSIEIDSRVLTVVRRALKDLDAGKTVAAYKRLEALVSAGKGRQ